MAGEKGMIIVAVALVGHTITYLTCCCSEEKAMGSQCKALSIHWYLISVYENHVGTGQRTCIPLCHRFLSSKTLSLIKFVKVLKDP